MKKIFQISCCVFVLLGNQACNNPSEKSNDSSTKISQGENKSGTTKIIFDTDMGPDYDDIGAITLLHALADSNEVEILATVASDGHPSISPTIEVFNNYFGRPNIPIGDAETSAPNFTAGNQWNDTLINRFNPSISGKKYLPAVQVYRKVLAEQPDNSVTIVTVGFMSNINALLKSEGDDISKLTGLELVNQKVNKWVAMAGGFSQGREFNVYEDSTASKYAFDNFPKPILFSGFEIGDKLKTGAKIAAENDSKSPVSFGYKYNFSTYAKGGEKVRSSWDQTAVLVAARDPEKYFYLSGPGKFITNSDGSNYWEPNEEGNHRFLIHKYQYQKIADVIDNLMSHKPKK